MTHRIPAGARLLAGYMIKRWRMYALLWAISTAGVAVQTAVPFLVRALLDDALPAREIGLVAVLALVVLTESATKWYRYLVLKQPYTTTEIIDGEGIRIPEGKCC